MFPRFAPAKQCWDAGVRWRGLSCKIIACTPPDGQSDFGALPVYVDAPPDGLMATLRAPGPLVFLVHPPIEALRELMPHRTLVPDDDVVHLLHLVSTAGAATLPTLAQRLALNLSTRLDPFPHCAVDECPSERSANPAHTTSPLLSASAPALRHPRQVRLTN